MSVERLMYFEGNTKKSYLKSKKVILKDFGIILSDEVLSTLENLYPDRLAIDRYVKGLIQNKLENYQD